MDLRPHGTGRGSPFWSRQILHRPNPNASKFLIRYSAPGSPRVSRYTDIDQSLDSCAITLKRKRSGAPSTTTFPRIPARDRQRRGTGRAHGNEHAREQRDPNLRNHARRFHPTTVASPDARVKRSRRLEPAHPVSLEHPCAAVVLGDRSTVSPPRSGLSAQGQNRPTTRRLLGGTSSSTEWSELKQACLLCRGLTSQPNRATPTLTSHDCP